MPAPAVVYNHGSGSGADAAAEARRALKAGVAKNLSVATYRSLAWSKSQIPTIVDLQALRGEQGGGLGRLNATKSYSRTTALLQSWKRATVSFQASPAREDPGV
jgi:hypothetical protein